MTTIPVQDRYDNTVTMCYGCGTNNEFGHQVKTYWNGKCGVTRFIPKPYHTAIPGFVYGGLIASLVDCHSTGTGSAFATELLFPSDTSHPAVRFVTASLHVDYVKPTPLGPELVLTGFIKTHHNRKITVESVLEVNGIITVRSQVIVVEMPASFLNILC